MSQKRFAILEQPLGHKNSSLDDAIYNIIHASCFPNAVVGNMRRVATPQCAVNHRKSRTAGLGRCDSRYHTQKDL